MIAMTVRPSCAFASLRLSLFSSYFMIKRAAHDDVADVSLCGLNSFYPSLPPRHSSPQYMLRYDTRRLWVMASLSISLLIRLSTAFSPFQALSQFIHNLLPLFFSCTTHLFITSWVIIPHSHFEMQRRPHRLFVSSILEAAIHARFSF
jgi:hypothetical protein